MSQVICEKCGTEQRFNKRVPNNKKQRMCCNHKCKAIIHEERNPRVMNYPTIGMK
jgi:ribosomal protein L24E